MKKYRFPSSGSKDPEERRLGSFLSSYIYDYKLQYDPEFLNVLKNKFGWLPIKEKVRQTKLEIFNFVKLYRKRPSASSSNKEEKKLHWKMQSYCSKSDSAFDENFKRELDLLISPRVSKRKDEILNFIRLYKRKPKSSLKNIEEFRYASLLRKYRCKISQRYDPIFNQKVDDLCKELGI